MNSVFHKVGSFFSRDTDHVTQLQDAASLKKWLVNELAKKLRVDASTIDPALPFADYGMDSMAAIRLSGDLEKRLGRKLEPTLLWEYPDISSLTDHLAAELGWTAG